MPGPRRHYAIFACLPWLAFLGCDQGQGPSLQSSRVVSAQRPAAKPAAKDGKTGRRRDRRPAAPPAAAQTANLRARPRATLRRSGGVYDLTFDDLEFGIERDQDFDEAMLTHTIRSLEGKRVILRGFILSSSIFQQSGIQEFVLVRDNQECCFGPGAYLYHNARVEMVPPKTADFSIRPVTVEGTLSIQPWRAQGKCYSIYHIRADKVR